MKKIVLFTILFLSLPLLASALSVKGPHMSVDMIFESGYEQTYYYKFTNDRDFSIDYDLMIEKRTATSDLTPYFTFEPDHFDDVAPGEEREFSITLSLPESLKDPGENLYVVFVKENIISDGTLMPGISVGVPFKIFVLYPTKFIKWNTEVNNMNINQSSKFYFNVQNLGKMRILELQGEFDIIDIESNQTVANIKTEKVSLNSREEKKIEAVFDNSDLDPGEYYAVGRIDFDGNIEDNRKKFKIGEKIIHIINYTQGFYPDTINKMYIDVESGWNSKTEHLNARIRIYDKDGILLAETESLSTTLDAWRKGKLEAYLDTHDLANGEYEAEIMLQYGESNTTLMGNIWVSDDDSKEAGDGLPIFMFQNTLIYFVTGALILILVALTVLLFKKKDVEEKDKDVASDDVVEMLRDLSTRYSRKQLQDMLLEKGWSIEKTAHLLSKIYEK